MNGVLLAGPISDGFAAMIAIYIARREINDLEQEAEKQPVRTS